VEFLDRIKSEREKNIIFGHFDMIGIDMEGGSISTFGLSPNTFTDAAKYVLSGHYHGSSVTDIDGSKLIYFGSPYPLTFANSDSTHGYWIWDESNDFKFIENTVSPTFKTIMDTDDHSCIGDLSNSFVRLYVNNSRTKEDIFNIKSLISSKKPIYISTIPYKNGSDEKSKTEAQRNSNKLFNMDLFSLSEIYIDNNSDSLPKLRQDIDPKIAVMARINGYINKLNLKK
jgi:DNA repair exonuclease SbcCD nuclease subunit